MELKSITASAVITEIAFRIDSWCLITSSDLSVSSVVSGCVSVLMTVLLVSAPPGDSTPDFGIVQPRPVAVSMGQHPAFTRIQANSTGYFFQVKQKFYIIALCAVWKKIHMPTRFSYPLSSMDRVFLTWARLAGPASISPRKPGRSRHRPGVPSGRGRREPSPAVGVGQLLDAAVSVLNPVPPAGHRPHHRQGRRGPCSGAARVWSRLSARGSAGSGPAISASVPALPPLLGARCWETGTAMACTNIQGVMFCSCGYRGQCDRTAEARTRFFFGICP